MKKLHKLTSRNAFEKSEVDALKDLSDMLDNFIENYAEDEKGRRALWKRLEENIGKLKPEAQAAFGAMMGSRSAKGTQEKIEESNRKLKKQLSHPVFAASYFASQRLTRNKVLRSRSL